MQKNFLIEQLLYDESRYHGGNYKPERRFALVPLLIVALPGISLCIGFK
jgi:hypothetical protein